MMFSKTTPAVLATLFLGTTLGGAALACSTDGWDSESGSIAVGSPFGATPPDINGVSRFEELCALRANGTGYVQTNAPSHSRVRARFYVFADLDSTRGVAGAANILKAFSAENGTGELFHIAYDDGQFIFDGAPNGGSQGMVAALAGWNLVEFDWDPATGDLDAWVNGDAASDPADLELNSGPAATMESVRLGLPDGLGNHTGAAYFDSFEMHNETAIGPLLNCDADTNGIIELEDAVEVIDEFFGVGLAPGTPDCDFNGLVELEDAVEIIDIFFGA